MGRQVSVDSDPEDRISPSSMDVGGIGRHRITNNPNKGVVQPIACPQCRDGGRCLFWSQGELMSQKARQAGGPERHLLPGTSNER